MKNLSCGQDVLVDIRHLFERQHLEKWTQKPPPTRCRGAAPKRADMAFAPRSIAARVARTVIPLPYKLRGPAVRNVASRRGVVGFFGRARAGRGT